MRTMALLLSGILILAGSPATAQESLGRIVRYLNPTVRVFDRDGQPAGPPRLARDLPRNPSIVEIRRGTYGIVDGTGHTVFVRGIDIQFELTTARDCPQIAQLARPDDARTTGVAAGAGSGAGCRS